MVPPSNLHELRSTLGLFVQSSRFIPRYAHIVQPLTALTRTDKGKPVPFDWTDTQQHAFDHVRNLLLEGIHLSTADYRLPFHSGGDASNDGKAYGIFQYCDLPAGTAFTVTRHSPTETELLLTDSNTTHLITHSPQPVGTSLGFPRHGPTPIASVPPFTWRPMLFSGVWPNAASGLSRRRSRSTPRATTYP